MTKERETALLERIAELEHDLGESMSETERLCDVFASMLF